MNGQLIARTNAPVTASIPLRLLAWMLSAMTMAAAAIFFDALAFPDMLAASALLALACAVPFQNDAPVDLALRQIMRYEVMERRLERRSTKHW